jgi:parallel beta-helix repeat protein
VKKLLLVLGALLTAASSQATTYYVAPNGSDANSGTNLAAPFASPANAVALAVAGDTVYLRGGTYPITASVKPAHAGTAASFCTIAAYPGEKPILNATGNTVDGGLYISKDYWHAIGIEVENCSGHGIVISGGGSNILEGCAAHDGADDGIYITGAGHDNLILNCDSYRNFKPPNGQDGDGFAMKTGNGPGNVYRGCRSWDNADDGYDFYDDVTNFVVLDHCWSFHNGYNLWNAPGEWQGNGNGFKLGGAGTEAAHLVMNCLAFINNHKGFDQNNATGGMTIYNCTGFSNQIDFSFPEPLAAGTTNVLKNNLAYLFFQGTNSAVYGWTNINTSSAAPLVMASNSWQGFNVTATDFAGLDASTATNARNADYSLPNLAFLRLAAGSKLIDAGVNVGLPYNGAAPDLGAFEYTNGAVVTQGPITCAGTCAGTGGSGFQLTVAGLSGHGPVVFYLSTNLISWTPIYTNPAMIGSLTYTDSITSGNSRRFYRAQEQ